jgi:hypothetical protein
LASSCPITIHESTLIQRELEANGEGEMVEMRVNSDPKFEKEGSSFFRVPSEHGSKDLLTASLLFLDYSELSKAKDYKKYVNKIRQSLKN